MRPGADVLRALPWMSAFFIAMAYLESAVVVYARALYYPNGFAFPLVTMERSLVMTELWREVATLLMLLAPAALVTRSALQRFAWFCYGFGLWDIFYYVWLKVLLGWPENLATWDLLFLVPLPWVGPVWAPCLISLGLISLGLVTLARSTHRPHWRISRSEWLLLIAGAIVLLTSLMLDPYQQGVTMRSLFDTGDAEVLHSYVPAHFPWLLFLAGCAIGTAGLLRIAVRKA
ncbi:MAG: hypothetical protein JNM31_12760 [Flavobacteriales bacterium]|nr:hypothetical protein [Flavobacteriales bacterium]